MINQRQYISQEEGKLKKDIFKIESLKLKSRLIVGTGKYKSFSETAKIGGDIGWINENSLNDIIKKKIKGLKNGQITKPIILSNGILILKLINIKNNTFLSKEKLKSKFNSTEIMNNEIVMSCGSSVTASSLALAYSIINDDYMAKIYIGSWTEYGKK